MAVRLPSVLVAAAILFGFGHAFSTVKTSEDTAVSKFALQDLSQTVYAEPNTVVNFKRYLRDAHTREEDKDDSEEERGFTAETLFMSKAGKKAARAALDDKKIRENLVFFNELRQRNGKFDEVYNFFRRTGHSEKEAERMGKRFQKYLENPSAYD